MKTGKTSAATLGLVGGLALGAWIGSEMTSSREDARPRPLLSPRRQSKSPRHRRRPPSRKTRDSCAPRASALRAGAPSTRRRRKPHPSW